MTEWTQADITQIAGETTSSHKTRPMRKLSAWEITTFILPMSIGHFRRVLRDNPDLPQGDVDTEAENAPRWFTTAQVETLRLYFKAQGRKPETPRPASTPLIGFVHPFGRAGKSTATLHMACAAALSGLKVLVIDGDPARTLTHHLTDFQDTDLGVLSLIARSYGGHLLRANQLRLDQGETPQPMEDAISRALSVSATDIIRPSKITNLDVIAAPRNLALADMQLGDWQGRARTWHPWRALHNALKRDGVIDSYDVIFCDTGAGVGPLNLAITASCDVLVMPVDVQNDAALGTTSAGLHALADGLTDIQAREHRTARALGQAGMKLSWRGVHLLLNADGSHTRETAAAVRAQFGHAVLPHALPDVAQLRDGMVSQFYDMPPRTLPRAAYMALRCDMDACWTGLLGQLI